MTEDLCLQIYLDSWLISQRAKTQCCSRESLLPVVRRGESNRFLNWVGQEPQAMSYTPRSISNRPRALTRTMGKSLAALAQKYVREWVTLRCGRSLRGWCPMPLNRGMLNFMPGAYT